MGHEVRDVTTKGSRRQDRASIDQGSSRQNRAIATKDSGIWKKRKHDVNGKRYRNILSRS